jgi:hypothetical protein
VPPVSISTAALIGVEFLQIAEVPPFDQVAMRVEWCRLLNRVPGVSLEEDAGAVSSWRQIRFIDLPTEEARSALLQAVGWAVDRLREGR